MKIDIDVEALLIVKAYRERMKHVEKNKWYMSEKAGKDVGWEKALLDYIINREAYLKD